MSFTFIYFCFCLLLLSTFTFVFYFKSNSALLTMPKPLIAWITTNCGNSERDGNTRSPDLPPEKSVCRSGSNG